MAEGETEAKRIQKTKKMSQQCWEQAKDAGAGLLTPVLPPTPGPHPTPQRHVPLHSSLDIEPDFQGAGLHTSTTSAPRLGQTRPSPQDKLADTALQG